LIVLTAIEILKFDRTEYEVVLTKLWNHLLSLQKDGLFIIRTNDDKDKCNGVLGHAWVLEALTYLYKVKKDCEYLMLANKIADQHVFDEKERLWHRPDYHDGNTDTSIDYTLNHQLWYAASLCEINQYICNKKYDNDINSFLENLNIIMNENKQGLICHPIYKRFKLSESFKMKIKRFLDIYKRKIQKPSYEYKENGYHIFNLMALARIKKVFPNNNLWDSEKIKKALQYIDEHYLEKLEDNNYLLDCSLNYSSIEPSCRYVNVYGYPYNVPGWEILYVAKLFGTIDESVIQTCYKKQVKYIYNEDKKLDCARCHDKTAIKYRLYELFRYLEIEDE
jgi:hypothetical protein